ncbi:hypothetical protein [Acidianus brierleyi]|uniref:hypothetical protein n=1 Tax=Acidianus brierleyi TaxID=41673 RepID=UPI0013A52DCF|nr:hypothetical protein [Acidianus brierleyi]
MKSKFKGYLKIMVILSIMILATISFINMANETQVKAMIPRVSSIRQIWKSVYTL